MIDDLELARRSVTNFGELLMTVGRHAPGEAAVIHRPDAMGARIAMAAQSPWLDAAVVPFHAPPPAEEPSLPSCLWTVADAVAGRREKAAIAMPCMGLELAGAVIPTTLDDERLGEPPSLELLGEMNDRAYGQQGLLAPLLGALRDPRIRTYGLRDGDRGALVCVALSLTVGDDLGIHYVATEQSHRRRGLASRLLLAIMSEARAAGLRTATLQASPDGLPVYQKLGFRHTTTLRAFLRLPPA